MMPPRHAPFGRQAPRRSLRATAADEPDPTVNKLDGPDVPAPPQDVTMKDLKKGTSKFLSESLESTSFTIIGDDADLNWALAQGMGKRLGWFAVDSRRVLLGLLKAKTIEELELRDGHEKLVAEEARMLAGLRSQKRIIVATLADGAAGREATYPDLFGSIIIWADQEPRGRPKAASPQRSVFASKAEVTAYVRSSRGFGPSAAATPLEAADKAAVEALVTLMPNIAKHLRSEKDVVVRKQKYVENGCRGDWPVAKPASWSPVHDALGRPQVEVAPAELTLAEKALAEWRGL